VQVGVYQVKHADTWQERQLKFQINQAKLLKGLFSE
jgi:hypothetical protein